MHALEILLNGRRVAVVSPPDDGLIMARVSMSAALLKSSRRGAVCLGVGGADTDQLLSWPDHELSLDDVVEIRVITATQSDPPTSFEPLLSTPDEHIKA
jgi:hypothetical protein